MNIKFTYDKSADVLVVEDIDAVRLAGNHLKVIALGNGGKIYVDTWTKKCVKRRIVGFADKFMVNPEERPYNFNNYI